MFCCCRQLWWRTRDRPVQHGGGVELGCALVDPKRGQCIALSRLSEVASSRRNSAVVMRRCNFRCINCSITCWRMTHQFQKSVPRVKPRKRRNGFRQSGVDWETAAACVKMKTESSVLIRPLMSLLLKGLAAAEPRRMFCCCRQLWGIRNRATHHPPACPAWGGVELGCALVDPKRGQCIALEPTAEVASSAAKLAVVMHNLVHQLLRSTEALAAAVRSAITLGIRR